MKHRIAGSALLLVFLGLLFSLPIAAKTWSAHGPLPGLATGLAVVVLVFLGPLAFLVGRAIETGFVAATSTASNQEITLFLAFGALLALLWSKSLVRIPGYSIPYVAITGWALLGAFYCVSIVFSHTT